LRRSAQGAGIKNPRLCRVNQAFEPFYKVGTKYWLFQAFCLPTSGKKQTCTPQSRKGPKFKVLAQRQMLITHIAGANKNLLICILNQLN